MSHASRADKLLIKPAAGARRRRRAHADSSFPRHAHGGQSPDESHAARRQPGWQLPQTDQPRESYRHPRVRAIVVALYGDLVLSPTRQG